MEEKKDIPKWRPFVYGTTSTLPELIIDMSGSGEVLLYHNGYAISVRELEEKLPNYPKSK